jgi:hypothetical protein
MSVLCCPHCQTLHIVTGPSDGACSNTECGGLMSYLDEAEAGAAIRRAYYGHDHAIGATVTAEAP